MALIPAYIDPGTGSMLFTILIGIVSAGLYAARAALLKIRFILSGGRAETKASQVPGVAIFVDSKRYWNMFEPICDELEARGQQTSYLTASPDDPALEKEYEHVKCSFIGEGNKAFASMNMLQANIVLSTTPGLDVYQWKRSRDVKYYVHVPHAVSDLTLYRMFGIDYYDAVLLTGEFQGEQVRALEEKRSLPAKETRVVGSTYMDVLAKKATSTQGEHEERTVLLAPSWGAGSILNRFGDEMIDALLKTGYHIVVRPHPQSFVSEKEMIDRLMSKYPETEQLEWNRDNDNFAILSRSDIMISDFSGVIWDFALAFDKPVIYTEPELDLAPYDACWLDEDPWTYSALPKVGVELKKSCMSDMKGLIDSCLTDERFGQDRDKLRDECWRCRGESAVLTVDYLCDKLTELNTES